MKKITKILGIATKIRSNLEMKVGFIKAAEIIHHFNELYNQKHQEKESLNKILARRTYTIARYLSRYYYLK